MLERGLNMSSNVMCYFMSSETPPSSDYFSVDLYSGTGSSYSIINGLNLSASGGLSLIKNRSGSFGMMVTDSARGVSKQLFTYSTDVQTSSSYITSFNTNGLTVPSSIYANSVGYNYVSYSFLKSAGFLDIKTYSGNSVSSRAISHSLGAVPEMIIIKAYTDDGVNHQSWGVGHKSLSATDYSLRINSTVAQSNSSDVFSTVPHTSTNFYVGADAISNVSGFSYVAYLFASKAGVCKIGKYTGNGTSIQVDCGFNNGCKFLIVKRIDAVGDWYVFDSARGIAAGVDPFIKINTTVVEDATTDSIFAYNAGYGVTQNTTTNLNVSSGEYIYYAIAV